MIWVGFQRRRCVGAADGIDPRSEAAVSPRSEAVLRAARWPLPARALTAHPVPRHTGLRSHPQQSGRCWTALQHLPSHASREESHAVQRRNAAALSDTPTRGPSVSRRLAGQTDRGAAPLGQVGGGPGAPGASVHHKKTGTTKETPAPSLSRAGGGFAIRARCQFWCQTR